MSAERLRSLTEWLFPVVLLLFVGLYLLGLFAGVEPELALARAAAAAIGLAILGRVAEGVLVSPNLDEVAPEAPAEGPGIDVTIDDETSAEATAEVPGEVWPQSDPAISRAAAIAGGE